MAYHNILIKVYANIYPAEEKLYNALSSELSYVYTGYDLEGEIVEIENDLLRISFEGIYFPIEEIIEIIKPFLVPSSQGKIDYIDLEAWRLTRYTVQGVSIINSSNSLNSVMDYSTF